MIKEIDMSNRNNAVAVLAIQLTAYEVEAELISSYDIPPLKDTVETLQHARETFIGYYLDDIVCGVISFQIQDGEIDIHRLFVAPDYFRRGITQQLLDYILRQFEGQPIKVATGSRNTPAIRFYLKNGFHMIKEVKVDKTLSLTYFERVTP